MDNLAKHVREKYGVDLSNQFTPSANYCHSMDFVEYITVNDVTVSHRIDQFLTLIMDKTQENIVGFKLKGFKYIFNTHLKPLFELNNNSFISLVSILEAVIRERGDEAIRSAQSRSAYKKALVLAKLHNTVVTELPMAA